MDHQANEIRTQKWAEIILECNRSGQQKVAWCAEHGINRKTFYYWQQKLRKQVAKQMSSSTSIVPLQIENRGREMSQPVPLLDNSDHTEKSVRIQLKGLEIVVPCTSPPEYIAALAKALVNT